MKKTKNYIDGGEETRKKLSVAEKLEVISAICLTRENGLHIYQI